MPTEWASASTSQIGTTISAARSAGIPSVILPSWAIIWAAARDLSNVAAAMIINKQGANYGASGDSYEQGYGNTECNDGADPFVLGSQAFEHLPQFENAHRLVQGEGADKEAPPGFGLNQFFLFQKFERIDQRRSADTQFCGQLLLANFFPGK